METMDEEQKSAQQEQVDLSKYFCNNYILIVALQPRPLAQPSNGSCHSVGKFIAFML